MTEPSMEPERALRVLCISEDLDRPTSALFAGLARAGVDVAVISSGSQARRATLTEAGVRLLDGPRDDWLGRRGVGKLRAELERGRYDVLHLLGNRALETGLRASRGLPVRIVAYRGIVGNVRYLSPVSWRRFLNPRIDRIICVADAVRDFLLRMLPPERLVRIYKGHSLDWYTAPPASLEACGIPSDAFTIACTANYRPRKGIEYLVDAMADLPREWNAHLVLIGNMDVPALRRRIRASPAWDRIHRVGFRDDAPSLVAACDVFVLPSIKREGLARSLIEAMAYGLPVVVTDCGGSPELVVDGESGFVVPVRDARALGAAIGRLYLGPEMRRRMGQAARDRIGTHFRIEDTIAQTLALYRSLMAQAG